MNKHSLNLKKEMLPFESLVDSAFCLVSLRLIPCVSPSILCRRRFSARFESVAGLLLISVSAAVWCDCLATLLRVVLMRTSCVESRTELVCVVRPITEGYETGFVLVAPLLWRFERGRRFEDLATATAGSSLTLFRLVRALNVLCDRVLVYELAVVGRSDVILCCLSLWKVEIDYYDWNRLRVVLGYGFESFWCDLNGIGFKGCRVLLCLWWISAANPCLRVQFFYEHFAPPVLCNGLFFYIKSLRLELV